MLGNRLGFLSPDDGGTEGGVKTIERSQELCDSTGEITNYKGLEGLVGAFYNWLGLKAKVLP